MTSLAPGHVLPRSRVFRLAEMFLLFVGVPTLAFALPLTHIQRLALLFAFVVATALHAMATRVSARHVGLARLHLHPGLLRCSVVGTFVGLAILGPLLLIRVGNSQPMFDPFHPSPGVFLAFVAFYAPWSFAQEWLYRGWFFHRYAEVLSPASLLPVNAALFGFLHLAYFRWDTLLLSTLGGLYFAHAYHTHRSLWGVAFLHALSGIALFLTGYGPLFTG